LPSIFTTRRRFLYSAAAAGAALLAGDSVLLEPNRPIVRQRSFSLPRWPETLDGFTIAQISDFHYDPLFSEHPLHAAIPIIRDLRPDLIVLTGDFVTVPLYGNERKAALAADPCAAILRQLSAPSGVWAILGNHDSDADPAHVTHALESQNIPVLANQSIPIERNGARFWLAGVKDALNRAADLPRALRKIPAGEPAILLAHEPDYADYACQFPIDLQLSGHSHGGQIRLPFLPPLYLPDMAKKYVMGAYQVGPLPLYTNAGLGTIRIPARLNCPPEIALLTLHPSKNI
jgi:predicted MPP superfamily phosphohydrolase